MQEMQKELAINFPFYEPQNNQNQNQNQAGFYQSQQQQWGSFNQPAVNNPQPSLQDNYYKGGQDNFQKPGSGEDEIKLLNKNSGTI